MSQVYWKKFHRDDDGTVAVIFGLSLVALTIVIGLAVDYSRAQAYYDRTQLALDAAALAVAKAAGAGDESMQLQALAQKFFDQAMADSTQGVTFTPVKVSVDADNGRAKVVVSGKVRTIVGRMIGIETIDKEVRAAAASSGRDIELGMMLDVSGSMRGAKIAALKSAAKNLVDTLGVGAGGEGRRSARIGIAPYSSSVNLGAFASQATADDDDDDDEGSSRSKRRGGGNTCVSERKGRHAFTDAAPAPGKKFGKKAGECPTATVMPLSEDPDTIKQTIDGLEADGMTAGHLGIAWAWYLVSDKWRAFWPGDNAPEEANEKLIKAVVLMTDGEFNTQYESDNGKSAKQAEQLCANMKAEGVMVFTVAFDAPEEVLPLFAECASTPGYAFSAKDGAGLTSSFERIAVYLNDLRIAE